MTTRALTNSLSSQIAFRYRATYSATGVSRETAKRLAAQLGVDETQAIHIALHDMAMRMLPQYEADDGALTAAQLDQIKSGLGIFFAQLGQDLNQVLRSAGQKHFEAGVKVETHPSTFVS